MTKCLWITALLLPVAVAAGSLVHGSSLNSSLLALSDRMTEELCPAVSECLKKLDNGEECDLLPVPERAVLPVVPPGTYVLTKAREGVYIYNDGAYLILILRSGTHVAVVDFPDSSGSNKPDGSLTRVTDAVEEILEGAAPGRIDMVYSHAHYDHIGGATRFFNYMSAKYPHAKIEIWGTTESRGVIRRSVSKRAVEPTIIVGREGAVVKLNAGLQIKLEIIGGHTSKDLVIYIPKYEDQPGVVMHVDVAYPRWAPFVNLALTENVYKYLRAQKTILELDFEIFVSGHLRIADKQDLMESIRFTEDILDAGAQGVSSVTSEDLVAGGIGDIADPSSPAFGNAWYAFIAVARKLQVDACYRIMIEKWGCRIGGLDLVLRTNCFTAISYSILEG